MEIVYKFRNKDKVLAQGYFSGDLFVLTDVFVSTSPVLYMLSSNDAFNEWVYHRQTPLSRFNGLALLKTAGVTGRKSFVDATCCLSLRDTFWLSDKALSWKSVSLFRNSFSKVYTDIASGVADFAGQIIKTPSPELSVLGNSCKFFKRAVNGIYLYKTSGGLAELQNSGVYAEFFASQLCNRIKVPHVDYEVVRTRGTLFSRCKLFTSESLGLIDICNLCTDASHLDDHIRHYSGDSLIDFCNLMVVDCLLLNVDRHDENMGFLFDTDTLTMKLFAPYFDFDNSLFVRDGLLNRSNAELKDFVFRKFPRTYVDHNFVDQFRMCITRDMYARLKVLQRSGFRFSNHVRYPLNKERLNRINWLFRWNLERLLKCLR